MLDPWAMTHSAAKKRLVRLLYEDRMLRTAASIHALNQAELDAARAFGLRNPICVIPNGVTLPEPGPAPPSPWAKTLGTDARVLLFLGRLHPKKNVHGLVDAIAILKAQRALGDWRLAIAGWDQGGYGESLAADVAARGLTREIAFLGALFGAQKEAALRNASAFALPSFSEGLPMAVLEAWAHGLPVAMTSACNLPAGFEAGAALEVATTPDALAATLHDFFAAPPQSLERMGAKGRALVENRFSWDAVAEQFLEVYGWMTGGGAPPANVSMFGARATVF
jgi:poly(glycerol-phosphate) alpha-glucosyltransferase